MSRRILPWRCRERRGCGGSACGLAEAHLEGWTTSGTTAPLCPSLTGTETSQVHGKHQPEQDNVNTAEKTLISLFFSPSVDSGDGNCVAMTTGQIGGFWDDKQCSEKFSFICERFRPDITPPTQPPTPPPAQGCAEGWTGLPHFRNCYRVNKAEN